MKKLYVLSALLSIIFWLCEGMEQRKSVGSWPSQGPFDGENAKFLQKKLCAQRKSIQLNNNQKLISLAWQPHSDLLTYLTKNGTEDSSRVYFNFYNIQNNKFGSQQICLKDFQGNSWNPQRILWSPTGKIAAFASRDKVILASIDVDDKNKLWSKIVGSIEKVNPDTLGWSWDGNYASVAQNGRTVCVYSLISGNRIARKFAQGGEVKQLTWNPMRHHLACVTDEHCLTIIDVKSLDENKSDGWLLGKGRADYRVPVCFSGDGNKLFFSWSDVFFSKLGWYDFQEAVGIYDKEAKYVFLGDLGSIRGLFTNKSQHHQFLGILLRDTLNQNLIVSIPSLKEEMAPLAKRVIANNPIVSLKFSRYDAICLAVTKQGIIFEYPLTKEGDQIEGSILDSVDAWWSQEEDYVIVVTVTGDKIILIPTPKRLHLESEEVK